MGAMKTMDESVSEQATEADHATGRSIADRVYRFLEEVEIVVLGFSDEKRSRTLFARPYPRAHRRSLTRRR